MHSGILIHLDEPGTASARPTGQSASLLSENCPGPLRDFPPVDSFKLVTRKQYQELTLRTALALLPAQADRVAGFLSQMLRRNRDPYLSVRVKPAIETLAAGDYAASRRWLERALCYLQNRLSR